MNNVPATDKGFSRAETEAAASAFKLLSAALRLRAVLLTMAEERSAGEIIRLLGASRDVVGGHIERLRASGVLQSRRKLKQAIYSAGRNLRRGHDGRFTIEAGGMEVEIKISRKR